MELVEELVIYFICDFGPVMMLLVFHFKNFSKRIEVTETTET